MKIFLPIVIVFSLFVLPGCQRLFQHGQSDDGIVSVKEDDAAMNAIIEEARASSGEFHAALAAKKAGRRDFSVKYPFAADKGAPVTHEHIWLSDLSEKNGTRYGVVANDPSHVGRIKLGDRVKYDPKKISDWKYVEKDVLVGGKSIVYLLKKLPESERRALVKNFDFKITGLD